MPTIVQNYSYLISVFLHFLNRTLRKDFKDSLFFKITLKVFFLLTNVSIPLSCIFRTRVNQFLEYYNDLNRDSLICEFVRDFLRGKIGGSLFQLGAKIISRNVRDTASCRWSLLEQKLVYGTRCSATKEKGGRAKEDDRETYNCSPVLGGQPGRWTVLCHSRQHRIHVSHACSRTMLLRI